ncbi:hypothetical protein AJ80_03166 [Polytolypa hystricis UAMH7299]|uniref:Uncharacterized protein n=1 Tax=Polytolypa hystricis (strain UAMH7299) TaxID=1447883 RepID=A0A2B7YKY1_POLH7|nr:hypothetical protein AJ80_03166 [Polytolypa hystricis UAMH7299]
MQLTSVVSVAISVLALGQSAFAEDTEQNGYPTADFSVPTVTAPTVTGPAPTGYPTVSGGPTASSNGTATGTGSNVPPTPSGTAPPESNAAAAIQIGTLGLGLGAMLAALL